MSFPPTRCSQFNSVSRKGGLVPVKWECATSIMNLNEKRTPQERFLSGDSSLSYHDSMSIMNFFSTMLSIVQLLNDTSRIASSPIFASVLDNPTGLLDPMSCYLNVVIAPCRRCVTDRNVSVEDGVRDVSHRASN